MFRKMFILSCVIAFVLWFCGGTAHATVVVNANNTTNLPQGSSWVGGVVPGSTDVTQWDS